MRTIRIGSGAGYGGDRIEPAVELLQNANLDYLIFECLAERTIALDQKAKQQDPDKGYNPLLEYRMSKILPILKMRKTRIITNMGSANPKAAAEAACRLAHEMGISDIKVAYVEGDDLLPDLEQQLNLPVLETGKPLSSLAGSILSANAYMGAEGIVSALEQGADIVITGRVSDPALVIGPLVHEFGWRVNEHPEQMGQGVVAGHLLECAGQVTGGYFADPGYKDVPNLAHLGYPYAEINEDGGLCITKLAGTGGMVTPATCKEQLIYEIHDPKAYLTPDAIADFSNVTVEQVAPDRVTVRGATSHGRPASLKVSVGYSDCFLGEGQISYGGSNCLARARLAEQIIRERILLTGIRYEEYRSDFIGCNALYGDRISDSLSTGAPHEVRLRVAVRTPDRRNAQLLAGEVEALYTNGPAGGGGVDKRVEQVVSVASVFVPRNQVTPRVSVLEV